MSSDGFFVKPTTKRNYFKPSEPGTSKKRPLNEDKPSKPFDKRQWREKKYSTNYKLEQWKKSHMKSTLRQYYKSTKHDDTSFDVQKIYNEEEDESPEKQVEEDKTRVDDDGLVSKKLKGFKRKAHLEFLRIQELKKQRKEDFVKKSAERAEQIKECKKKKLEKFKKLNKKTKKGQPIMKDRLEMLLEQIQNNLSSEK